MLRRASVLVLLSAPVLSWAANSRPWLDSNRTPDERAELAVEAMSLTELISLLHGPMAISVPIPGLRAVLLPADAIPGAGYIAGVHRLGIPSLYETDASLGVTNPFGVRPGDVATALPAGLALSATFNPPLAYEAGALVGNEARSKGFNVLLGGGINLARDPRNGRNFEYLGEDPLLAGMMAGEEIRGTQDQHVISTIKHFALNSNETNRQTLDARISRSALRESDLLAFEIAIERGRPGAVMCAYNKVNGDYSCGNGWLLNDVLKNDWGFRGWVMSDWGAVHSANDAILGLDQQSGEQLDQKTWFGAPLESAVRQGVIPISRVRDMARRILRSMFAVGVVDTPPVKTAIDYAKHALIALKIARQGMVLLKNERDILPIPTSVSRIAVIGGFANIGVLSGGGSSQVTPSNGPVTRIPLGGRGMMAAFRVEYFDPSSPLAALRSAFPASRIDYDSGMFPADAASLAAHCDIAIVFVTRHEMEGYDIPNMRLPQGQDELVEAVAKANPRTIVVLETGNPVTMPWADQVLAILAAWYPGQEGGQAIADVLSGAVNPSGHLPITFPMKDTDTVRAILPNLGADEKDEVSINYSEGSDVGYRWYSKSGITPRFSFGHGLSYTRFSYDRLRVSGGKTLTVSFVVRNDGDRSGADVPQIYLTSAADVKLLRLIGFLRVELNPGQSREVSMAIDPRLLGSFDENARQWVIHDGLYQVSINKSSTEPMSTGQAYIKHSLIPRVSPNRSDR